MCDSVDTLLARELGVLPQQAHGASRLRTQHGRLRHVLRWNAASRRGTSLYTSTGPAGEAERRIYDHNGVSLSPIPLPSGNYPEDDFGLDDAGGEERKSTSQEAQPQQRDRFPTVFPHPPDTRRQVMREDWKRIDRGILRRKTTIGGSLGWEPSKFAFYQPTVLEWKEGTGSINTVTWSSAEVDRSWIAGRSSQCEAEGKLDASPAGNAGDDRLEEKQQPQQLRQQRKKGKGKARRKAQQGRRGGGGSGGGGGGGEDDDGSGAHVGTHHSNDQDVDESNPIVWGRRMVGTGGGARLLAAGDDRVVACFDMVTPHGRGEAAYADSGRSPGLSFSIQTNHQHNIYQADWRPGFTGGEEEIVTCAGDGEVRAFPVERMAGIGDTPGPAPGTAASVIVDPEMAAVPGTQPLIHGFAFMPTDGRVLYAASGDGRVLLSDRRLSGVRRVHTVMGRPNLPNLPPPPNMVVGTKMVLFPPRTTVETARFRHEYHLFVGRETADILVYDIRNLSPVQSWSAAYDANEHLFTSSRILAKISPAIAHIYADGENGMCQTGMDFTKDGTALCASFQNDCVYSFGLYMNGKEWHEDLAPFDPFFEEGEDALRWDVDEKGVGGYGNKGSVDDGRGSSDDEDDDVSHRQGQTSHGASQGDEQRGRADQRRTARIFERRRRRQLGQLTAATAASAGGHSLVSSNARVIRDSAMYVGHLNSQTFLKTVRWFGAHDEFLLTGCDNGRAFVYDRYTTRIVGLLDADEQACNGVIPHPTEPCFATYGVNKRVRVWQYSSDSRNPGAALLSLPPRRQAGSHAKSGCFSELHHLSDVLMSTLKTLNAQDRPHPDRYKSFLHWKHRVHQVHLRSFSPHLEPYQHFNRRCAAPDAVTERERMRRIAWDVHCLNLRATISYGMMLPYPRPPEVFFNMRFNPATPVLSMIRERMSTEPISGGLPDASMWHRLQESLPLLMHPTDLTAARFELLFRWFAQTPDSDVWHGVAYKRRRRGGWPADLVFDEGDSDVEESTETTEQQAKERCKLGRFAERTPPLELCREFKALGTHLLKTRPDNLRWALELYVRAAQFVHPLRRLTGNTARMAPFTILPSGISAKGGGEQGAARQQLHVECLLNIAMVCLRLGDAREAIRACDVVIAYGGAHPTDASVAKALFRKGMALVELGPWALSELESAVECFSQACSILPDEKLLARKLGETEARLNKVQARQARKYRNAFKFGGKGGGGAGSLEEKR